MNVLLTSIGRRGYLADYFRETSPPCAKVVGTTDRHAPDREFTVGLSSCDKAYVVPPVAAENYVDAILEICAREEIDFLFSALDIDNYVLSQHTQRFTEVGVLPFVSSSEVNRICLDKYMTYQFLQRAGIPTPATFTCIDEFLASGCSLPVIVKPRSGCASEGVTTVRSVAGLEACFESGDSIIQEAIEGEEYGLDIFNGRHGELLSYVVKKKLRMRAGETDQAVTVREPRLCTLASRISTELGHFGPLDVDVLVCENRASVIDFNPRFGGGYPLAHAAGADFPQLMLDILLGKSPEARLGDFTEHVVMLKDTAARTFGLDELRAQAEVL